MDHPQRGDGTHPTKGLVEQAIRALGHGVQQKECVFLHETDWAAIPIDAVDHTGFLISAPEEPVRRIRLLATISSEDESIFM